MAVTVALRPEKIELACERPAWPGYNVLQGKVLESAYFGQLHLYRVTLADGQCSRCRSPVVNRIATATLLERRPGSAGATAAQVV